MPERGASPRGCSRQAVSVIIIPKKYKRRAIELAMETISKESKISLDIALNVPATRILSATGSF